MKFSVALLLNIVLAFAASLWLPWWTIAITGFMIGLLIPQRRFNSFLTAFLALFLLWGLWCVVLSSHDDLRFASKISMLILKLSNGWFSIIATALIGGLVAGLGALSGSFLRPVNKPRG